MHCRCELVSGLRFDSRCFLLCGQVEKSSLRLFREGCVKAIWAFFVGEYGCAFSRIFHVTKWCALLSFSFQMCSLIDVADDLYLSLKLDVCWLYRVLISFSSQRHTDQHNEGRHIHRNNRERVIYIIIYI